MKLLRVTNSNIKEYHHFKICPAKEIEMVVEKELKKIVMICMQWS